MLKLSTRQKQVLRLVCFGKLHKEIADELGISPRTVEVHCAVIAKKINVRTVRVAGFVALALREGIITQDELQENFK